MVVPTKPDSRRFPPAEAHDDAMRPIPAVSDLPKSAEPAPFAWASVSDLTGKWELTFSEPPPENTQVGELYPASALSEAYERGVRDAVAAAAEAARQHELVQNLHTLTAGVTAKRIAAAILALIETEQEVKR